MRHTAINDDCFVHALIDSICHAADLGDHAACNDAGGLVALDLGHLYLGDEGGLVLLIPQQTRDIGHGHQLFGLEGNGDLGRSGVRVDVVRLPEVVHAHGGDHRDKAAVQQAFDQGRIHMDDLAHMTQLRVQLGAAEHLSVHAAQTHAAPAQLCHKVLVYLTGQHLLHDLHGGIVRHPQTVCKVAFHAHLLEHLVDGGAAAVHQHYPHAQQRQGDKVVHHGVFQRLVDHGVAAVLDDHGSAMVLLDIRGGLRKKPRHFFVFHLFRAPVRFCNRR